MNTIILIDDERSFLNAVSVFLQGKGFSVKSFSNPVDALQVLRKLAPSDYDLIITDLNMPELNGYQVKDAIKSFNPDCPILLWSSDINEISDNNNNGFEIEVSKFVELDTLIVILNKLITQYKRQRSCELLSH